MSTIVKRDEYAQSILERAKSFGGKIVTRAKQAGQLAAKEAEKTKLKTITLNAAYRALGKDIYQAGRFRDELPQSFSAIDYIYEQIAGLNEVRPQVAEQTFAEKAKAATKKAKDTATAQALSVKASNELRLLGQTAYENFGSESGPTELVKPIIEAQSRLGTLQHETELLEQHDTGALATPRRIAFAGVICVGLLCLMLVASLFRGTGDLARLDVPFQAQSSRQQDGSGSVVEGKNSIPQFTLRQLRQALQTDEVGTINKYNGKQVAISGQINSQISMEGKSILFLYDPHSGHGDVACHFDAPSGSDSAYAVKKDSLGKVTVVGQFAGRQKQPTGAVMLTVHNCRSAPEFAVRDDADLRRAEINSRIAKKTAGKSNAYRQGYEAGADVANSWAEIYSHTKQAISELPQEDQRRERYEVEQMIRDKHRSCVKQYGDIRASFGEDADATQHPKGMADAIRDEMIRQGVLR